MKGIVQYIDIEYRNEIGDTSIVSIDPLRDQITRFLTRCFINHANSVKFSVLFNIHSLNKLIRICKLIKIIIGKFT